MRVSVGHVGVAGGVRRRALHDVAADHGHDVRGQTSIEVCVSVGGGEGYEARYPMPRGIQVVVGLFVLQKRHDLFVARSEDVFDYVIGNFIEAPPLNSRF